MPGPVGSEANRRSMHGHWRLSGQGCAAPGLCWSEVRLVGSARAPLALVLWECLVRRARSTPPSICHQHQQLGVSPVASCPIGTVLIASLSAVLFPIPDGTRVAVWQFISIATGLMGRCQPETICPGGCIEKRWAYTARPMSQPGVLLRRDILQK